MNKFLLGFCIMMMTTVSLADSVTGKIFVNLKDRNEKIRVSSGNRISITSKDFLEACGYSRDSLGSYLNGTYTLSEEHSRSIITIKITDPCNANFEFGGFVVEENGLSHIVFSNAESATVFQEKLKK